MRRLLPWSLAVFLLASQTISSAISKFDKKDQNSLDEFAFILSDSEKIRNEACIIRFRAYSDIDFDKRQEQGHLQTTKYGSFYEFLRKTILSGSLANTNTVIESLKEGCFTVSLMKHWLMLEKLLKERVDVIEDLSELCRIVQSIRAEYTLIKAYNQLIGESKAAKPVIDEAEIEARVAELQTSQDARECLFEYFLFVVDTHLATSKEMISPSIVRVIEKVFKLLVLQRRLPEFFRPLLKVFRVSFSERQVHDMLFHLIEHSDVFAQNHDILPVNFRIIRCFVDILPDVFESWLLEFFTRDDLANFPVWVTSLPVYYIMFKPEMSEEFKKFFSQILLDYYEDTPFVLNDFFAESGFLELYPIIAGAQSEQVFLTKMDAFKFIMGRYETEEGDAYEVIQSFAVSNHLHALLEAILIFDRYSFFDEYSQRLAIMSICRTPSIDYEAAVLLATYREIDSSFITEIVSDEQQKQHGNKHFISPVCLVNLSNLKRLFGNLFDVASALDFDPSETEFLQVEEVNDYASGHVQKRYTIPLQSPSRFDSIIASQAYDHYISLFTTFLIRLILAKKFAIPFASSHIKRKELIFLWRTVIGHVNFFVDILADKYPKAPNRFLIDHLDLPANY